MQKLFLLEEDDLKQWVREAVREELKAILPTLAQNNNRKDEALLTRKEIAQYLRISLVTLHDWMKRGLPAHRKRGRVLFFQSEVLQWLKENPSMAA